MNKSAETAIAAQEHSLSKQCAPVSALVLNAFDDNHSIGLVHRIENDIGTDARPADRPPRALASRSIIQIGDGLPQVFQGGFGLHDRIQGLQPKLFAQDLYSSYIW